MGAVLVDYLAMFSNKNDCFGKLYLPTDAECKKCLHNAMCKKYFEQGIPQEHLENAKKKGIDTDKLLKKVQSKVTQPVENEVIQEPVDKPNITVEQEKAEPVPEVKTEKSKAVKPSNPKEAKAEKEPKVKVEKPKSSETEYGFEVGSLTHFCAKLIADGNGITLSDLIEQVEQAKPGKGMFVKMFINNVNKNIYKSATHKVVESHGKLFLEAK